MKCYLKSMTFYIVNLRSIGPFAIDYLIARPIGLPLPTDPSREFNLTSLADKAVLIREKHFIINCTLKADLSRCKINSIRSIPR